MPDRTAQMLPIKHPVKLMLLLAFAGAIALSIHVGMLLAGVPFPEAIPPRWVGWLNQSTTAMTLLAVLRLAQPAFGRLGFVGRTLLLFLVVAMIRETVRGVVMNGVVTTTWASAPVALSEAIVKLLALAILCTAAVRWATTLPRLILLGLVIAGVAVGFNIAISAAFSPLDALVAPLTKPDAYQFPYPPVVMIPAYLTFAEAVIGAVVLARLVWPALSASTAARIGQFALMVALVRGVLLMPLLFSFFMTKQSYFAGVLSYSQFTLEFLALGAIVGIAWELFGQPRAAPKRVRS